MAITQQLVSEGGTYSATINSYHGIDYQDEFGWLRDQSYPNVTDPKILQYLSRENELSKAFFAQDKQLLTQVFEEIKSRSPLTGRVQTWQDEHYLFEKRYKHNAKYPTYFYTRKASDRKKVLFDAELRARDIENYYLESIEISPDYSQLAWVEDTRGDKIGTLSVKSLENNKGKELIIEGVSASFAWAPDSKGLYYINKNREGKAYQINYVKVSTGQITTLYTEIDQNFWVDVYTSVSKDKIFINTRNWNVSETIEVNWQDKNGTLKVLIPRSANTSHTVQHTALGYVIKTNLHNNNFDVFVTENATAPNTWRNLLENRESGLIKNVLVFSEYVATRERSEGVDRLRIVNLKNGEYWFVNFSEDIFGLTFYGIIQDKGTATIKLRYQSLITPRTIYSYNMKTRELTAIDGIFPPGFDKSSYETKRLYATGHDGVKIPISLIRHKQFRKLKKRPLLLYVYGAYGDGIPPEFPRFGFSAIDRGMTYAVAHVRGGDELGKHWHDQGKLLNRKNTFEDFLSVADYLVENGYTTKGNISATGESSGGTVLGVAINNRPELFKSISVLVPFVDVVNTLMDSSLEYSIYDWTEFGNPTKSKEVFDYMMSYSPYENVRTTNYPDVYATAAKHDPAVGYWEVAKWIAKLKKYNQSDSSIFLGVRNGGHVSAELFENEFEFSKLITFILRSNQLREKL
ncbi:prolyl oligopeptidase family serine peptidase [Pseudoalteromonas ulvae]|uniref:prolyl oligopeptidase family serine peptidase n=1 Tax=Pseudoalteromonas ulvae TaxID=107327 RepID=UPI00186B981A|nr:prolyl oligopeptidase family serine peptidase [Pseudoalteromonas ulvae]